MRAPALAFALLLAGTVPPRADAARGPVGEMLQGCVDGRALRMIGSAEGCAPASAPTLTACGTGASLSPYATDFAGRITIGPGTASCTLVLSRLYASPAMHPIAQTNTALALALSPVVSTAGGATTAQIPMTAAPPAGATITYVCFPT